MKNMKTQNAEEKPRERRGVRVHVMHQIRTHRMDDSRTERTRVKGEGWQRAAGGANTPTATRDSSIDPMTGREQRLMCWIDGEWRSVILKKYLSSRRNQFQPDAHRIGRRRRFAGFTMARRTAHLHPLNSLTGHRNHDSKVAPI